MKRLTCTCAELRCAILFAVAVMGGSALAQAERVYTVQPGDNLYELSRRYLEDPAQWRQLQRINRVSDPRRLMPGSTLQIPASLARAQSAVADVLHVAAPVGVQVAPTAASAPLLAGARVGEGAQIDVGEGGFVTLRLADGSLVRLPGGTRARLRELRHAPAAGHVQSRIQLEQGRVDATVTPLPTPRSRFEVFTPRAVGGVRGTTFGVAVGPGGDLIGDVREGAIEVRSLAASRGAPALVRAGQGARVGAAVSVASLLAAPDLSSVPDVLEDIARLELPLVRDAGAQAWHVRVSTDEAAQNVVRNATFNEPLARFAGVDDGNYLVSVRALDAQGIPGAQAVRRVVVNARPQAPLLLEPRPGSRAVAPMVELSCTETGGVVGYRFQVARDAAFKDLVAQTPDLDRCQHVVRTLQPGAYLWRVAAVALDAQGQRDQGPFSAPVPFEVIALPPTPDAPRTGSGGADTLAVAWGASPGGPWTHQLQIARDAAFAQLLDDQRLASPSFTRPMPAAGTYHLRVRQIDAQGLAGAWSASQRLDVQARVTTSDAQPLHSSDGRAVRPGTH
jgi:hypothetical protein